jgi:hypothetical protein
MGNKVAKWYPDYPNLSVEYIGQKLVAICHCSNCAAHFLGAITGGEADRKKDNSCEGTENWVTLGSISQISLILGRVPFETSELELHLTIMNSI